MDFITEVEFARMMGVSKATIQRIRRQGQIPYIPGYPILFDRKDVDAFLSQRMRVEKAKKAKTVVKPRERTADEERELWARKTLHKLRIQAANALVKQRKANE